MEKVNIKIIIGSTRQNRFSEKVAYWMSFVIKEFNDINWEFLDLRDYKLPFLEDENLDEKNLEIFNKWREKIEESDGYLIISPEYNHSFPAVLKNNLDYLYKEWFYKPVTFISYGSAGGARSIEQLRLVSIELRLIPLRNSLHLPREVIQENKNNEEILKILEAYNEKIKYCLKELIVMSKLLKEARMKNIFNELL
jgi:NAD(P)H-dependent FMN reductase